MLLGRDTERAQIDELLTGARSGRSGCVVVTGDPGIGKSALLTYAQQRSAGMTVLSACGYESESQIPFAGLSDLLHPVLGMLERLPLPQAAALQSALSLGPPVPGDRFSVCAATVGMLAAAAEDAPVLVILDDMHWLDGSSREAILFAARRLHVEHLAMVMASRPVDQSEIDFAGVRQVRLNPLDADEAEPLLTTLARGAPPAMRRQIYEAAAGNPLGIQELCHEWSHSTRSFPGPGMPADSQLTRALRGRLDGLPEPTLEALMLVAASAGAETDVVLRAAGLCGLTLADFAPAEELQILVIDDRRIVFRHPLLRSVVYGAASMHARTNAHAALAQALTDVPGDGAADARARHLSVARLPPDDETAHLLIEAGTRARRRGGHGEAAIAFEQAARFSGPQLRPAVLLRAARGWQLAGRSSRVLPLLAEALPLAEDPRLRAMIRHMDAYLRMWRQRPADGLERMMAGAREIESIDAQRAVLMNADSGIACVMLGRIELGVKLVQRAYDLGQRAGGVAELVSAIALAAGLTTQGRRAEAKQLLADRTPDLDECDPLSRAQELAHAGFVSIWLEQYAQAERWLDRVTTRARRLGALGVLPQILGMYAELCFRTGRWSESRAAAEESVALAAESRQADLYSRLYVARLDGLQGRDAQSLAGIEHVRRAAEGLGADGLSPYLGQLEGLLALGRGDVEEAVAILERVQQLPMSQEIHEPSIVPWAFDLVEAYARAGDPDAARALLEKVTPAPDDDDRLWARAVAARCRGLLAPADQVMAEFGQALALHEQVGQPFERARTLLCLGERLRRERHRAAARGYLRQAMETFEQLGAVHWVDRSRSELTATGETLTQASGVAGMLTPQELQVATVVARGASNSEAAAALFLSPKTIEYHLSNIYRKTRLKSRTDLAVLTSAAS
jgi:DNA-binding CsgD family transcriptional regulator